MSVSDATPTEQPAAETSGDEQQATAMEATPAEQAAAAAPDLGDAGKKAIDAMKAERNQYRDDLKAVRAELDAIRAAQEGREAEHKAQLEAQRMRDEALSAANDRIKKAEVRAAASKALNDPADALRFLDLSEFEVGADGEVDTAAIAAAIDRLVTEKPYLAAATGPRFQGSADAGARNESSSRTAQLTQADMARMTPEQIADAHDRGQFDQLIRGQ